MANTDKELISDAITGNSSFVRGTSKYLDGAGNVSSIIKRDTNKKLNKTVNVSSIINRDTNKKLNKTANISSIIKRATDKKLNKTANTIGNVNKSTHRTFSNTVTATATKEVNDATITLYYNGNTKIGLGAEQGARFDIIISGTFTTFSITVNGKTLTYTETVTDETITIDNVNATCKNGSTNKMSKLTGDVTEFLTLLPGNNSITYSKSSGNVDFTFDFRSQFI